jgi:hypothetical protein
MVTADAFAPGTCAFLKDVNGFDACRQKEALGSRVKKGISPVAQDKSGVSRQKREVAPQMHWRNSQRARNAVEIFSCLHLWAQIHDDEVLIASGPLSQQSWRNRYVLQMTPRALSLGRRWRWSFPNP